MSRTTHNKSWEDFRGVLGRIISCDDKNDALKILNGVRNGMRNGKDISPVKIQRIDSLTRLIDSYKKF